MKVYGFVYESVMKEDAQQAGCASVSTEVWMSKQEALAAMIASANAELQGWFEETGDEYAPVTSAGEHNHIWCEAACGYWSLFEAELKS